MPDLCIGYFEPENEDGRAGILEKKYNDSSEDLVSRVLLAIVILVAIFFIYT